TFWPRSCPSWPILATRMRGRRPSASANSSTFSRALATAGLVAASFEATPGPRSLALGDPLPLLAGLDPRGARARLFGVHAGDDPDLSRVPPEHLLQRVGDLPDPRLRPRGRHRAREQALVFGARR